MNPLEIYTLLPYKGTPVRNFSQNLAITNEKSGTLGPSYNEVRLDHIRLPLLHPAAESRPYWDSLGSVASAESGNLLTLLSF